MQACVTLGAYQHREGEAAGSQWPAVGARRVVSGAWLLAAAPQLLCRRWQPLLGT